LTLGCWDHWVPRANDTLIKLCNEWGEKNKVEVRIDFITSQGEKDKLTAAAEAQAGTGHDIMSHRDWNIQVHQRGARASRRCRQSPHQSIWHDQSDGRVSRQDKWRMAGCSACDRQPGETLLLAY
jgi:hypothetical protein